MKRNFLLAAFVAAALALSACGCAGSCIRVDGEYEGFSGGVEYCFSSGKSAEAGTPAFDSAGKTLYAFSEDEVQAAVEMIEAGSLAAKSEVHPDANAARRLKRLIGAEK